MGQTLRWVGQTFLSAENLADKNVCPTLACYDHRAVQWTVAVYAGIAEASELSGAVSPDLAAWLVRELMAVTLRELSATFVLTHLYPVRNLIRRADRALLSRRPLRDEIEAIRQRHLKAVFRP